MFRNLLIPALFFGIILFSCSKKNNDNNNENGGDDDQMKERVAILTKKVTDRDESRGGLTWLKDTSLMVYYPLDADAANYAGRTGLDGVIPSIGPVHCNDRFGAADKAFLFDGQSERYNITPNDTLIINETAPGGLYSFNASSVTLSLWICYFDEVGTDVKKSTSPGARYIFNKGTKNGANMTLYIYGKDKIIFEIQAEGTKYFNVSTQLPEYKKWQHIVCQYNKNSNIAIYLNGELKNTSAISNSYLALPSNMSKQIQTTIGCYFEKNTLNGYSGFGSVFDGMIDDIRIYQRALTDSEITKLYHEYGY